MFMDTDREKQIGLGPKWPFDPLGEAECLASSAFESSYSVRKNETIMFHIDIKHLLKTLRHNYNVLATENGWEQMEGIHNEGTTLALPCRIVDFFSDQKTYGKIPTSGAKD